MIKQAKVYHLPQIAAIEREIFSDPWSAELLARKIEDSNTIFCVAEDGDAVKGYAILQLIAPEAEVINIAVVPSARQQGIGRCLLEVLLREAETQQIETIHLEVRESNQAAIVLYRAFSFQVVGLRKHYYQNPREHAIRMCCQVRSKHDNLSN